MDLEDKLIALSNRIPKLSEQLKTEAATSTALVMPFIAALGYDVFDPIEVVPEFTADVGIKKGEKVDYALQRDGEPIVLIEVKCWNVDLGEVHASQLYRYFSVTNARFSILTNGIQYRFFTDLEETNKMDERPFFEFDMTDVKRNAIDALRDFTKSRFDMDALVSAAGELKYTKGIVRALADEARAPSEDFVKHFAKKVYSGMLTKQVRGQFTDIVRRAFQQFINERINERLESALSKEESSRYGEDDGHDEGPDKLPEGVVAIDGDVETTQEEVDAFNIVRAIVADVVDPDRVTMRDTKSYCGVLLDDNNRKPVCRLRFNARQNYLGLFDAQKHEERVPIEDLKDIYAHKERLRAAATQYDDPPG